MLLPLVDWVQVFCVCVVCSCLCTVYMFVIHTTLFKISTPFNVLSLFFLFFAVIFSFVSRRSSGITGFCYGAVPLRVCVCVCVLCPSQSTSADPWAGAWETGALSQ